MRKEAEMRKEIPALWYIKHTALAIQLGVWLGSREINHTQFHVIANRLHTILRSKQNG